MFWERIFMIISFALIEFMHGFALSFCGFMMLKKFFFRETKKFFMFSICSGVAISAALLIQLFTSKNFSIDGTWVLELFMLLLILCGWLLLTKRNSDSLLSVALAVIFTECIINNFRKIVFACIGVVIEESLRDWREFVGYVVIYLVSFGYIYLLATINKNKEREPLSKWNMLLLTGIVLVITILIEIYFTFSEENIYGANRLAIIPVSVTLLFIIVAVVLSVKSSQTRYYSKINQLSEEYMAAQAKHFEKVRESDTEMRRLRHDMKNHVLCMNELYRLEKYHELGEYLKQLSNTVTEIQASIRTGNEIVDAIISEKMEEAENFKIKIHVDGDFKGINISAMDLCTILSNLLDNAVEATKVVKEPHREIFVSAKKTGSFFFLTVKNRTAFYVEISDGMKTTKSNKKEHGFGIGNVDRAVKRCGGEFRLDCNKSAENYVFTAEVMVPLGKAPSQNR